ncbi:MAG: M20/M25/M40 family metallo-hydrolase [Spirochaetaceae bacterium]|nr:MAG: M20/M25/M40 family metallo-hydrolase [Spirochaetaceae bacterium]
MTNADTQPTPLSRGFIGEFVLRRAAYSTLQELCEIGTRFPGTPGETKAQTFIEKHLTKSGYTVTKEAFTHLAWKRGSARLSISDPVTETIDCFSLAGSPSTDAGGVSGKILFLGNGTPADFEKYKDQIQGRIVLVTSLAPTEECTPPRECHRRTKYGRSVQYGAKAFLFMNSQPGMLPQAGSTRQNRAGEIPAVTIPFEHGQRLKQLLSRGDVEVHLETKNENYEHETYNIVADLPGRTDNEIVVVGAHYDCHDNAHGAVDNGSGVALTLEIARALRTEGHRFHKTIRFVFLAVEEMASVGSSFFVVQHRQELDRFHLFLNLDGIGQQGGKAFDTQGFDDLEHYIAKVSRDVSYPLPRPKPSFAGDSLAFVRAGVPTAAMKNQKGYSFFGHKVTSSGEDRGWGHTSADTIDKVSPHDFDEAGMVALLLLSEAANVSGPVAKNRSNEEALSVLKTYGMTPVLEVMKWPSVPVSAKD